MSAVSFSLGQTVDVSSAWPGSHRVVEILVQSGAVVASRNGLVQHAGPARASNADRLVIWSRRAIGMGWNQSWTDLSCSSNPAILDCRKGGPGRATPQKVRQWGQLASMQGVERDGGMGNGLGRRFHRGLRQHVLG